MQTSSLLSAVLLMGSAAGLNWSILCSLSQMVIGAAVTEMTSSHFWQLVQAIGWNWRASIVLQVAETFSTMQLSPKKKYASLSRTNVQAAYPGRFFTTEPPWTPLPSSTISKFSLPCLGKTHIWDILQFNLWGQVTSTTVVKVRCRSVFLYIIFYLK